MESLYLETNNQLQHVHYGLANLERCQNSTDASETEQDIQKQLAVIQDNCERMDMLARKEPPSTRRNAQYRVNQLKYDFTHVEAALHSLQQKLIQRWQNEAEREELLSQRFTTNQSTAVHLDDNLEFNERVQGTNRQMDELIDHGHSVLGGLRSQHASLKGVKRKVLDVAQTLGMSNTVMRLIERRTAEDKLFLFGGMLVTSVLMFLLYRWLR